MNIGVCVNWCMLLCVGVCVCVCARVCGADPLLLVGGWPSVTNSNYSRITSGAGCVCVCVCVCARARARVCVLYKDLWFHWIICKL